MLCEKCGNKPAVVRLTKIINNKKSVMNLCADCAEDVQSSVSMPMLDGFGALLSGLAGFDAFRGPTQTTSKNVKSCPVCKSTIKTINENGKLGCSECYVTFIDELRPLLRKIHGNCVHNGAMPFMTAPQSSGSADGEVKTENSVDYNAAENIEKVANEESGLSEVEKLRVQMQEAIKAEEFEKAAELRDKIKAIEQVAQESKESEGGKDE